MIDILIIDQELNTLTLEINSEHDKCQTAMRRSLEHARRCGELLLQAKAKITHGGWLPWLKNNCSFGERTARAYMRIADNWPELIKSAMVTDLTYCGALALLAEPKLEDSKDVFERCLQAENEAREAANNALVAIGNWLENVESCQECIILAHEAGRFANLVTAHQLRLERKAGEYLNSLESEREAYR